MKIVTKQEFYQLPDDTLYSDYKHCDFTGLKIKKSTLFDANEQPIDFVFCNLIGNIDNEGSEDFFDKVLFAEEHGTSIEMDFDDTMRDSMLNDNQLFAIYEKSDVEQFIKKLQALIKS